MKLNKIMMRLMVFLSIMIMTTCSFNKNSKSNQSSENILDTNDVILTPNTNDNITLKNHENIRLEEIQKNNVVYFDFDKYDIHSIFNVMLDDHANLLRANPSYEITVEGHADERGTPEYNISLGERRANAIKTYLQNKGVSSNQIFVVSYGKEKPAVLGHCEEAYAKNRRAVLVY